MSDTAHQIVIIDASDWELWYVDNELKFSGHEMEREQILQLAQSLGNFTFTSVPTDKFLEGFHRMNDFDRPSPKTLTDFERKLTDDEYQKYVYLRFTYQ